MNELPTLIWAHQRDYPYLEMVFQPAVNNRRNRVKPQGGLWTSPATPTGSVWTDWCHDQRFRIDHYDTCTIVAPRPDANIVCIDTAQDLIELLSKYQRDSVFDYEQVLDFTNIACDFDAIRLTERGQRETRFSDPDLYGWDVETVLWLKMDACTTGKSYPTPGHPGCTENCHTQLFY